MAFSGTLLRSRRVRKVAIAIVVALAALVVLCGLGLFALWLGARQSLPQLDGHLAAPGLGAPVAVVRDAQGVPHVTAANLDDLFFAQGFVTAQDRLWQMDMTRRFASGELAEVMGAGFLAHDRRQRALLIRQAAERSAALLPARERAQLEAYARGVNAAMNTATLPLEFRLLRYQPRPWTPTDSLLVACSMVQMLSLGNVVHELSRQRLTALLPPELAADLYPNQSWRDRPVQLPPDWSELLQPDDEARHSPAAPDWYDGDLLAAFGAAQLRPGSNNWVLSGAHTASGHPLLANDMHLEHQIPNVWYEAHLSSGEYNVVGVTMPGLPYVIAGHNARIAWGFTNLAPAVIDLFIENFNAAGEYQTPEGWRQPEHHREVIRVRRVPSLGGFREEIIDVVTTRHGPLIAGANLQPGTAASGQRLALKWTIQDPRALQVPLFELNMARNWGEFRQALSRFGSPAQNVVYADADGHIGYQATGLVPTRASGDGALPVPGADDSHEWTGHIPFERLPSLYDPPAGVIATANGRIAPDGYPLPLSNEWGTPYRTERIYHVLETDRKYTRADMLALQMDVYSDFDRFCAQRFVYAIDRVPEAPARLREAADLLRRWDGRATSDSAAATINSRARQELTRLLLAPKLGQARYDYRWAMAPVWLENVLQQQPQRWMPPGFANWEGVLAAAVNAAVNVKDTPTELSRWHWGRQMEIDLSHMLFGQIPILRRWAGPPRLPQSGSGYTVKQVGPHFGPSERLTVDFGNLDQSTLNIVNGQSGQIFSPHFNDQWQAWYDGSTFSLPFTDAAVAAARRHNLTLEPK